MKFEGSFKNGRAQDLLYRAFIPEDAVASVIFVHGLGEHSLKYDDFAERFYGKGIAAFSYDQRGHGRSEGRKGHIDRFEEFVEDLRRLVDIAKVQTSLRQVYLIGQSLGGLISLLFAIEYGAEARGVVASSPALRLKSPLSRIEAAMAGALNYIFPRLSVSNRVRFEDISHDPAAIRQTKEDELSHRLISVRLYEEMGKAMARVFKEASRIKVPTLLLHGTDDRVTDVEATKEFYERVSSDDKEIKLYPGLFHELFREVGAAEIQEYVLGWVLKRAHFN